MQKIGLLSDTHGHLDDRVLELFTDCDEIWHAGDIGNLEVASKLQKFKTLRAVYGNIDGQPVRSNFPKDQRFLCEEVRVWMTHIGGYPGRYSKEILAIFKKHPPDLFICGHSHICKVQYDKQFKFLHMNPGAAGISGFHRIKTILRFEIEGKIIKNLEVVELGSK